MKNFSFWQIFLTQSLFLIGFVLDPPTEPEKKFFKLTEYEVVHLTLETRVYKSEAICWTDIVLDKAEIQDMKLLHVGLGVRIHMDEAANPYADCQNPIVRIWKTPLWAYPLNLKKRPQINLQKWVTREMHQLVRWNIHNEFRLHSLLQIQRIWVPANKLKLLIPNPQHWLLHRAGTFRARPRARLRPWGRVSVGQEGAVCVEVL